MAGERTAAAVAEEIFRSGLSCAPAVLAAFAPRRGLSREHALLVATAFGSGVAGCAELCGAVSGGLLAIGLARGRVRPEQIRERDETYRLSRLLRERFAARAGSIVCRELLGVDISTPEGLAAARERALFKGRCPAYVRLAAELVEELLAEGEAR